MTQENLEFLDITWVEQSPKENILLTRRALEKQDFVHAKIFHQKQLMKRYTQKNLFKGSLYSILSAHENYKMQMKIYNQLTNQNLDNPQNIIQNQDIFTEIISPMRFPRQKGHRLIAFCEWWLDSDTPNKIIKDVHSGRKQEFNLRDKLTEAPGLGLKTSSLVLNTFNYQNVVPVDRWVMRYLYSKGYVTDEKLIQSNKIRGPSKTEFNLCEEKIQTLARQQDISPLMYQLAIWCAFSVSRGKVVQDRQQTIDI